MTRGRLISTYGFIAVRASPQSRYFQERDFPGLIRTLPNEDPTTSMDDSTALTNIETEVNRFLREGRTQDMLVRATARTAPRQFAVNHDGGNASDTVILRLGSHFGLLHIVDHYLM